MNGKLCEERSGTVGSMPGGYFFFLFLFFFLFCKLLGDTFLFGGGGRGGVGWGALGTFQPRTERFHQTRGAHQVFGLMPQVSARESQPNCCMH